MTRSPIDVDFLPRSTLPSAAGVVLLAAGILAVGRTTLEIAGSRDELAGIELQLAEKARRQAARPRAGIDSATVELAAQASAELATPWTDMLTELERAGASSHGDVVVLIVEPDRVQHKVRVLAEARSLAAALGYLQRLQRGSSLRDAVLESHEIRTEVAEHPVRVQIAAAWARTS